MRNAWTFSNKFNIEWHLEWQNEYWTYSHANSNHTNILILLHITAFLLYCITQLGFHELINRFRLFVFHKTKGSKIAHLNINSFHFWTSRSNSNRSIFLLYALTEIWTRTLTPIECLNVIFSKMIRDITHTRTRIIYPSIFLETRRLRPQQQLHWNGAHNLS